MENFVFKALPSDLSKIPSISSIPSIPKLSSSLRRFGVSKPKPPPPQPQPITPKTLPPDLLLRIITYLPIPSLSNFARACRRFKILVYDDELWEQHLTTLGKSIQKNNTSPVIKTDNFTRQSLEFDSTIIESQKKLGLVPGLPLNSFLRSRTTSTGLARETFKKMYTTLLPYYIDFRTKRKDSRLFKEYTDPTDQAKMLARLTNFGKLNVTYDSDQINSIIETIVEYFENSALHHFELAYDAHNINEMKKWATRLLNLNGGITCIQVYIQKNSIFFDHLYSPMDNFVQITALSNEELSFTPMSEFFSNLEDELKKQAALIDKIFTPDADVFHSFAERVFEDLAVVAAYIRCLHVAEVLWKEAKPSMDKLKAEKLMYHMFETFMDEYLMTELTTIKLHCDEQIEMWNQKLIEKTSEGQTILVNPNREVYKHDYLKYFRKILTLPAQRQRGSASVSPSPTSSQPSYNFDRRGSTASFHSTKSFKSFKSLNSTSNSSDLQAALSNIKFDQMQQLLSVEMALHMIHANKNALHRISVFLGYPDKMGYRIKSTLERIFIMFLQALGLRHIKRGFDTATQRLGEYKPDPESTSKGLAPLVEFFELVHIADLIQQMVQVYYEEEMSRFIDKTDFFNICTKEKKTFEKTLDDSVAAGLNIGIQVLIDHVEFILSTEQRSEEFYPQTNTPLDLKPTKACVHAVECLSSHAKLVVGCSDKNTLDVFFQEIGIRFFGSLVKHLKKFTVNINGGFQVISDLNHYCSFATTLKQPNITPYFIALKELGNVYIISNARDVGLFVREAGRFKGIFLAEEVYEFCQKREDWLAIKHQVEKELYGLKPEDCVLM
ncbi:exocyst complex component Sec10-domain-containing protein [Gigaspora rosea]|uniref:Exocyst complex component Sec10-domain-containing protein n=1 Tax=Gigaspora rosea TaxID=44941 RepID=A0A397W3Z8_9GLOM|nr:exocyst complex component Sec10-domain-containing protein [Gigaspora rosea]